MYELIPLFIPGFSTAFVDIMTYSENFRVSIDYDKAFKNRSKSANEFIYEWGTTYER
jgi:hypothetical protein